MRKNPTGGQLTREGSYSSRRPGNSDTSPLRRSFSDTRLNSSSANSFPRTNATFHVAQRTGAPLVREMIAAIEEKTAARSRGGADVSSVRRNDAEGETSASSAHYSSTPEAELAALSNCALDPYYRVIISASAGIPAMIRSMKAFIDVEEVQASGCAALASACARNRSNQASAGTHRGVEAVMGAMRRYPESVGVQSAGCDALDSLTAAGSWGAPSNVEALRRAGKGFDEIMERAMGGFLPPSCREAAKVVLQRTRGGEQGA